MGRVGSDVLLVGLALFAMFFGAGNLIFPPYLGLLAGTDWPWALLGFVITGIGMPLLGIMAAARAGGTVEQMAGRVSPVFASLLSVVIILAIGPLLAIPRTGAAAFELGVRPSWPAFPSALFSVIYFGITLWFALNRSAVVERIGRILTPLLLLALGWIILEGVLRPLGPATRTDLQEPFGRGFREGYQTMDALASLVFAQIIVGALALRGYHEARDRVRLTSLAGLVAALGLACVYGGLVYLGATASGLHPAQLERTDLLIDLVRRLMGGTGQIALGVAVSLACLTTAIALTATVADYFSRLSGDRLSYRLIALATVVFSGFFATVGVTAIVNVAYPLLVTVYPVAIVLIVLTLVGGSAVPRAVYVGAVAGALLTSIPEALTLAGLPFAPLNSAVARLPFAAAGFAWIVPSILGALTGLASPKPARRS